MKNIYMVLAFTGALIWSATVFLRETALIDYDIIRQILWVAPNIGAVWMGVGFTFMLYPYIFKKEFNTKNIYFLIGIILLLLLASEIIHHFFMESPFDIWDMIASLLASIVIILIHNFGRRR